MSLHINPYIRLAMHHTYLKGYYIERHIWDHEIIFIDSGVMKITIEDQVYYAKKNDCILLRPNVYHKIEWSGVDCDQPHVHFDFYYQDDSKEVQISMLRKEHMNQKELTLFREDFYKSNQIDIPYVFPLKEPSIIRSLLFRLIDEYTYKLPYSDLMKQGTLAELVAAILRDYHLGKVESYSPYYKELNELTIYMVENVDLNLTLDDLADHSQLGKWNLIQTFKRYYNTTPMKYFTRLRYNRTKNLLQYSNLSIKEITYKMNFESPQSFSRWFKMMDGNPPGFYQKKTR
ncbi:MAG: AraC family transcriptional regulator [Bacilli bacterium]|nr:AraC family transcriptional regulator [Bacilli bacterium]